MKKNKKIKNQVMDPVVNVNDDLFFRGTNTSEEPGSVAELIELLQSFPESGKVTLNGNINIDFNDRDVTIFPKAAFDEVDYEGNCVREAEDDGNGVNAYGNITNSTDNVIKLHLTGIAHDNSDFMTAIRESYSDTIVNSPVMVPNHEQLCFEKGCLHPNQSAVLDEIRHHNAYVAECLGELHRREIAALLEYNTQCLAHFGVENNITMCNIVDNGCDAKVTEF